MADTYKIKELAEKYNITTRTIRFWEEKGLLDPVFRTSGNRRVYGKDSLKVIECILEYKNRGLSLDEIKSLVLCNKQKLSKKEKLPVRILLDSTSSISEELVKKYNIDVIPLYVNINKKQFMDGFNLKEDDFYKKIEGNKKDIILTTSPATVEDFFSHYSRLVQEGAKVIYSLHISEVFSKTVENARKAAEKFSGVKIKIFDSKTSGQALTMMALALIEKVNAGWSEDKLDTYLETLIKNNWLVVTITSLKTLNTLGLLNINIETAFGSIISELLNFRPVLLLEKGEGVFKILSRVETFENALKIMETNLKNTINGSKLKLKMLGISHSRLDNDANVLKKRLESEYKVPVLLQKGSVVLCTHLGPMSMGVNALFEE
ncbi:MAG: DegV family protein [Candidatus Margulisbacteria bacterium]|nr:DegV family protein [Candidatus Margulisiibacteriota bacterium]